MWRTGRLAKYLGVDRSVLHYYDSQGIIQAKKDTNNYRAYSDFDLIALCEARHLRSMGFSLEEAAQLLRSTDFAGRDRTFQQKEQEIDLEIKRLSALKYLLANHHGKHRPVPRQVHVLTPYDYGDYYYLPLESSLSGLPSFQDHEALSTLVKDAPYINYCFHFPTGSCTDPTMFRYEFGVSFQAWWRNLAPAELPIGMDYYPARQALSTMMLIERKDTPLFHYGLFSFVRDYCAKNGLSLTGEAMVFPRIQFYEEAEEAASLSAFFFLNN